VSVLSYGAWVTFGNQRDEEVADECMKAAYDAGVNFFDNAEVYASGKAETVMGNIIKKNGWKRSDLVISTKIFWGGPGVNDTGLSRKHIIEGLDAALNRLQLDYVDLLFCHRPDLQTPIEETVRAMNHVINQGKVFYWGTSEWTAEQLLEAYAVSDRLGLIPPLMEQPQYSMLHRTRVEKEYANLYRDYGLGTTIWSPLASGLLTGKYTSTTELPPDSRLAAPNRMSSVLREQLQSGKGLNGLEETNFDTIVQKVNQLTPIAKELGCTLAQLAIAWCVKNPHVSTVITGASRASQVEENMKSLEVAQKLTDDYLKRIEEVLKNKPAPPKEYK